MKHRLDNPVASFECARVKKLFIYVTSVNEKHSSTRCPAAKHPKHNKIAATYEKNQ